MDVGAKCLPKTVFCTCLSTKTHVHGKWFLHLIAEDLSTSIDSLVFSKQYNLFYFAKIG